MILPTEIMDTIVMKSCDLRVGFTLKRFISSYTFDKLALQLHKQHFKQTLDILKKITRMFSSQFQKDPMIVKIFFNNEKLNVIFNFTCFFGNIKRAFKIHDTSSCNFSVYTKYIMSDFDSESDSD